MVTRRRMLLSAAYTALAALTGCKLRIEPPIPRIDPMRNQGYWTYDSYHGVWENHNLRGKTNG